jgi:hypothetical protein
MTTDARFISCRGKPTFIWSDHGTNFVGEANELKELGNHNKRHLCILFGAENALAVYSRARPTLGSRCKELQGPLAQGGWQYRADVRRYGKVLTQIEACFNSRPLVALTQALTPGHFLIGHQPSTHLSLHVDSISLATMTSPGMSPVETLVMSRQWITWTPSSKAPSGTG